jgi:hypothetical protein
MVDGLIYLHGMGQIAIALSGVGKALSGGQTMAVI